MNIPYTADFFTSTPAAARPLSPQRELGAYEALWSRQGAWFDSIADIFRQHPGSRPSEFVSERDIENHSQLALAKIRDAGLEHFGVRVNGDGDYPARLRDAVDPLELLYFQGDWNLAHTHCLSIVGTREPSALGRQRAAELARSCVAAGFTVVAGLARGIDTISHTTAMRHGGSTIAVLGTPLDHSYPPENRDLQRRIVDGHLVISQVPFIRYDHVPLSDRKAFFAERNATMAALSEATVIVEAGGRSGALIQARHALRQGRKLFVPDACCQDPALTWPTKFLQQGAIRFTTFDDVQKHLATADSRPPLDH